MLFCRKNQLQPGAPEFRAGDHELMSTVFVGEAHPPQGDPDKMFTVRNPIPGEKAAGPVESALSPLIVRTSFRDLWSPHSSL